jgi:TRAP-type mannitol/chloroaromatic compound transport system permease small subunit
MNRLLFFIDSLSGWVGKAFAWCILVLTLGTTYEVFMRYLLRDPTDWAFDMSYIMYGALFMMAGAYTLSRDGHVRGDVIYRLWPPRVQATIELVLYLVFFFPGMAALIYAGIDYASESWSYMPFGPAGRRGEISINSPAGVPVSPLKTILPVAAFFCFLQGIAEVGRCVLCLKQGKWPERLHDVEEMEDQILRELQEREHAIEHQLHLDEKSEGGKP